MKILLFGKNGQVGWELNRSLQGIGDVIALGRDEADFSRPESLRDIVRENQPDTIINAVAYTAVDKAEEEESLALIINGVAPGVLAEEALKCNALFVHYSTDYVFDGTKDSPYVEADEPNPINAYGRTKLAGEQAVQSSGCDYLIFRTSWVYASRGHNFVLTILRLAAEREELSIVADQIGSPTSARLIAETTTGFLSHESNRFREGSIVPGLYHLTCSGETSWHGFTEAVIEQYTRLNDVPLALKTIRAISSADYPTAAQRPMNSRLSNTKIEQVLGESLPEWHEVLSQCIEDMKMFGASGK
jgi:dTDP-4-dehydrorhamnose reductase